MNPLDHQLDRLLRAAAPGEPVLVTSPAFGLETRVVAAWRAARENDAWYLPVFLRGLAAAGTLMALSLLPLLAPTQASAADDQQQLADSTVQNLSP